MGPFEDTEELSGYVEKTWGTYRMRMESLLPVRDFQIV